MTNTNFVPIEDWGGADRPIKAVGRAPYMPDDPALTIPDLWSYSRGHIGFFGWLVFADTQIRRTTGVGLLDLPDRLWRDQYDNEAHPCEYANEVIAEEKSEN